MQILSHNKKFITVQNNSIYVSWFTHTNKWLIMQEPAWLTFNMLINQHKRLDDVLTSLQEVYDFSVEDSMLLIKNVEKLSESVMAQKEDNQSTMITEMVRQENEKSLRYTFCCFICGKLYGFEYDHTDYFDYLFASLEPQLALTNEEPKIKFKISRSELGYTLRRTNNENAWHFSDLSFLKGRLYLEIMNLQENNTDEDWMSVVHGAAVTNGKKTLLFVADSGKGKSTMTALLHAHGYGFISDDMVAINKVEGTASSAPGAISVKPGSLEILSTYYKELVNTNPRLISGTGKEVRYISPRAHNTSISTQSKVSHIIYLEYDPNQIFELERADFEESLQRFNSEAWIVPKEENVLAHLNWLAETPAYRMTFSDNKKAVETCIKFLEF